MDHNKLNFNFLIGIIIVALFIFPGNSCGSSGPLTKGKDKSDSKRPGPSIEKADIDDLNNKISSLHTETTSLAEPFDDQKILKLLSKASTVEQDVMRTDQRTIHRFFSRD